MVLTHKPFWWEQCIQSQDLNVMDVSQLLELSHNINTELAPDLSKS